MLKTSAAGVFVTLTAALNEGLKSGVLGPEMLHYLLPPIFSIAVEKELVAARHSTAVARFSPPLSYFSLFCELVLC